MTEIINIEQKWKQQRPLETITLGMGCFWGPEARFGQNPGVVQTRVGFAGGTKPDPIYRDMGDHTETVQIAFDPELLPLAEILTIFWRKHNANRPPYKDRQYLSLLLYENDVQLETIHTVKQQLEAEFGHELETEITPLRTFTLAEERHQKYFLKRFKKAVGQLCTYYPDEASFRDSVITARLNGFVREFGSLDTIEQELTQWEITETERDQLVQMIRGLKW